MLRLVGLPSTTRYPRVTVSRAGTAFELRFHGPEHETRRDVDLRTLGEIEDLESTELQLLARLQQLGYEVERRVPEDGPEG
jgi:hypothetical protein